MTTHWHVYTPVWDVLDLRLASAADRFQLVRTRDLAPASLALAIAGPHPGPVAAAVRTAAAIVRQCDLPDCAPR